MEIESFARVFFAKDENHTDLLWSETTFSRRHTNGANESVQVSIAIYDLNISVSEIPKMGKEKALEFLRALVIEYDKEQQTPNQR